MIEVKIPKEIKSYQAKLYYGFSLRQIICLLITGAINIPLYIFSKKYIGSETASWIAILISIPLLACGFYDYNGMPFEKFFIKFFLNELVYPQKRKYKTENLYELLLKSSESELKTTKEKK